MRALFIVLLFFTVTTIRAQSNLATGFWRTHLDYSDVRQVEKYGNRLFGLSKGNLFYIDLAQQTLTPFGKIQGLNDVGVTAIKYHPLLDVLIIGYESGNIDILQDNIVYNVPEIKNSTNIFGTKKINHIFPYGNMAYLSSGVGLVHLDVLNLEIKDSYTDIGAGGARIEVYNATLNGSVDSIFINSEEGVKASRVAASVNLKDYRNWHEYNSVNDSVNGKEITGLVTYKDTTYAGSKFDGIFYYINGTWNEYTVPIEDKGEFIRRMEVSGGQMHVVLDHNIFSIKNRTDYEVLYNPFLNFHDAGMDNGLVYTAQAWAGIRHFFYGYTQDDFLNGPFQGTAFHLKYYNGKMVSCTGGFNRQTYERQYIGNGFNEYDNNIWTSYNSSKFPEVVQDVVASEYNYADGALYAASYHNGLLKRDASGNFTLFNASNAPFFDLGGGAVHLTDVEMDNDGGLWIANVGLGSGDKCYHVIRSNGTWESYGFPFYAASRPLDIVVDENNTKWVVLGGTGGAVGILVFDESTNSYKHLTSQPGSGGLPTSIAKSIAIDKEGQIWVGTEEGVAVFYDPERVFTSQFYEADRPIFENRPLLREEAITCIAVDGGNRKWIGTANGLWLFNPTGTELVSYFNIENSPLLSNYIQDVEINDLTGEVFIATDAGLMSYRGSATEGKEEFEVEIFPNPITTDFNGILTITGLVENSNVKITDISGKLMYETTANGGTAVWNMRDYNDITAKTGVYLIFAASQDGEEAFVGKVALIQK